MVAPGEVALLSFICWSVKSIAMVAETFPSGAISKSSDNSAWAPTD